MLRQDMVRVTCHFPSFRALCPLDLFLLHRPTLLRSHMSRSSYFKMSQANLTRPPQQVPAVPPLAPHPRRNISSPRFPTSNDTTSAWEPTHHNCRAPPYRHRATTAEEEQEPSRASHHCRDELPLMPKHRTEGASSPWTMPSTRSRRTR